MLINSNVLKAAKIKETQQEKNKTRSVKISTFMCKKVQKAFSQTFQLPGSEVPSIFGDTHPFSEDPILLESYDPPDKMQSNNANIVADAILHECTIK